jgi:hypothetical protein
LIFIFLKADRKKACYQVTIKIDLAKDRFSRSTAIHVMAKNKEEATMWARAGALGLKVVLPSDWDVH